MTDIDLNVLAADITDSEKGAEEISIAQVKEILGILGRRWRCAPTSYVLAEVEAIVERAGTDHGI